VTEFPKPGDLATLVAADLHRWLVEEFLEPKLAQGARGEVPRTDTERLLAAIKDLGALNQELLARLRNKGFVVAEGERSVAAGRITDSTVITGHGNTLVQSSGSGGMAVGNHNVVAGQGGVAIGGNAAGDITIGAGKPRSKRGHSR